MYHQSLPLSSLMEYLANFVTQSAVLVTKARITKATALIELGYINEAYLIYRRVLEHKDLPKYGQRVSESSSRIDGPNYNMPHGECYYNNLTPEDDKNQPAIQYIQKPLDNLNGLKKFCSPTVIEMV